MPLTRQRANPFYFLLVATGILFSVTACAYGVMTVKQLEASAESTPGWLMSTLDRHGATILAAEIGLLAICTVAAITTDEWFTRKSRPPE